MASIWVYAELGPGGQLDPAALELLSKARELGDAAAVALGPGATDAAKELGQHGARTVFASDDPVYDDYVAEPSTHALAGLVADHAPDMILFALAYDSRDVAGRLSAKLQAPLVSNATDVIDEEKVQTAIFGGELMVDVKLEGAPKLVIVRPKSFAAEPVGGEAEVVPVEVDVPRELRRSKRVERHEEAVEGPKLEEARVVLAGGRGLGDPSNFAMLEELAEALGATAVGATRAVVDAGWVPYAYQVGQTGKTVKPDVYIAIGVSGATQHMVGMKSSKRIIAINKDEEAPIFSVADLGIVGDALVVVPQLIQEIRKRKGQA
ncbi:electron transfer flavoprotein subunit alpha/FixB family protein [soil metagenome]